ncbi:fibroblast growth factor 1-like isoform X2 [Acanthopagrus latus]|uniref:fibroblast growth factor 1-like isoform X2 n=1 Tax=Acanthopagrus latus TaxID=8177 RepID=UPI00187BC7C8|nr:fibroblast growth factor 1-like isoform X2 [Acanthopagrus latus]
MKAALSSTSCFLSCLRHSPGDTDGDRGGSALSLQTPGLHSDSSKPQSVCRMSEGDVTVLPFGPASLDLSRQEPRTLTRLYSRNGGYHLRILADGTVNGGRQENDPYDVLRLKAVSVGVVVIRGERSGRYLAMNSSGRLYGSCLRLFRHAWFHLRTAVNRHISWKSSISFNYISNFIMFNQCE